MSKPMKEFKTTGGLKLAKWENTNQKDKKKYYTYSLNRSYAIKENDGTVKEWKNTNNLREQDLPGVKKLIELAMQDVEKVE